MLLRVPPNEHVSIIEGGAPQFGPGSHSLRNLQRLPEVLPGLVPHAVVGSDHGHHPRDQETPTRTEKRFLFPRELKGITLAHGAFHMPGAMSYLRQRAIASDRLQVPAGSRSCQ